MEGPTSEFEHKYLNRDYTYVAGVDEVGRGCLAGPVVAAAVILDLSDIPKGVNDSKKLTPSFREKIAGEIQRRALAYAIGVGSVEEIDSLNILNASKLAMVRAISELSLNPDIVLVDGNAKIPTPIPQETIVRGDQRSVSIAAASVLAKVYRDHLMVKLAQKYPGYDFASNKGYGSLSHRKQLQKEGRTEIHRLSFSWTPV